MAKTLAQSFSKAELEKLEQGLPRLSHWSASILVPFAAHQLANPSVVWTNHRWFFERGIDLSDEIQSRRAHAWLIEEFGWVTSCPGVREETKYLYADRYGATDGVAQHGGSGRVATLGCFQAKGVGRTPLVSEGLPEGHSHGCLSIAEALREAIFAELASAEFPHGAVPVIAIIDTGLHFSSSNPDDRYDQGVRRAILVRPSVIRPAHAERAPLFKRAVTGFVNRQGDDVQRTRDMIVGWVANHNGCETKSGHEALFAFVRATVEQIAFGQVHRFFSGGYFSSNVSISGELLDFGNAHALPNWASAQVHSVVLGLGDETNFFKRVAASLAFYFTKYLGLGSAVSLSRDLQALIDKVYHASWRRFSLELLQAGVVSAVGQDALYTKLRSYFEYQQKSRVKYRFGDVVHQSGPGGSKWLHEALIASAPESSIERQTLFAIDRVLRDEDYSSRYVAWWTAVRLLKPRMSVDRKYLLSSLEALVPCSAGERSLDAKSIEHFVTNTVDGARRYWPNLPKAYAVHAHIYREGCSALLCSKGADGQFVWLEGLVGDNGELRLFNMKLKDIDTMGLHIQRHGTSWSATCQVKAVDNNAYVARFGAADVPLPDMLIHYEQPAFLGF